jgi:hypothetical protein
MGELDCLTAHGLRLAPIAVETREERVGLSLRFGSCGFALSLPAQTTGKDAGGLNVGCIRMAAPNLEHTRSPEGSSRIRVGVLMG